MIYTNFTPSAAARPRLIGTVLCRGAYPVDCHMPERLEKILEKLGKRR
jgi:hypothetical protein